MKPRIAFYWCASCGGCEEAVVDLDEALLDVTNAVEIVFWPVALDFKRKDIEALPDGSILAAFINGAIRNSEQREMVELLRTKARVIVAFGICAQLGGIPGLANLSDAKSIFAEVYRDGVAPQVRYSDNGCTLSLPAFDDTVETLDAAIDVDYYVPGCPPTPNIIRDAVNALLSADLPPKGAVLAPDKALCEECPRRETRPEKLLVKKFKRVHQVLPDQQTCLLAQGLVCLGAATRAGCEARCIHGNMPCTGCFGPTSRVRDFGAKALSAIASVADCNEESSVAQVMEALPDPVGTFYRYSLPSALLSRRRME
ncbi:MAG TPA: F420-nonreducing hydrogenase [Candidatus Acidoferrales bacterium]|nr:F420-nonreducing hydrogenase [Candidatus Acidoferrales bacterium]